MEQWLNIHHIISNIFVVTRRNCNFQNNVKHSRLHVRAHTHTHTHTTNFPSGALGTGPSVCSKVVYTGWSAFTVIYLVSSSCKAIDSDDFTFGSMHILSWNWCRLLLTKIALTSSEDGQFIFSFEPQFRRISWEKEEGRGLLDREGRRGK